MLIWMLFAAHTHSLLIFENLSLGTGDDDLNTQEQQKREDEENRERKFENPRDDENS